MVLDCTKCLLQLHFPSVIFLPLTDTDTHLLTTPQHAHRVFALAKPPLHWLACLSLASLLHIWFKWFSRPHLQHLIPVAGHAFLVICALFPHFVLHGLVCACNWSAKSIRPLFLALGHHSVLNHFYNKCRNLPGSVDLAFQCVNGNLWPFWAVFGVASVALLIWLIAVSLACHH